MHWVNAKISQIDVGKNEWLSKKEVARALDKSFVPIHRLEELYEYTRGNPFLVHSYIESYNGKNDTLSILKECVISIYEEEHEFNSVNEYNLIATCSCLSKISFSLFANLAYHYRLSNFQLNKLIKNKAMFYEDNGFYKFYPFYLDYLNKKIAQSISGETKEKLRAVLVSNLIKENNFLLEYYLYAKSKVEKMAMEKRIIEIIINQSWRYYDNELKSFNYTNIEDKGLKLLVMLLSEKELNCKSILFFLDELKTEPLFKVLKDESIVYITRRLENCDTILEEETAENIYAGLVKSWLKGDKTKKQLPDRFYGKYGFFNVPDHLIYNIDENHLLKESDNRLNSFLGRVSVLYKYFLKGEEKKAGKLFLYILRWYKKYLVQDFPGIYYFILAWQYYSKKSPQKAIWYLEEGLKKVDVVLNKIFMLKFYNLYIRILFEEKDIGGMARLLSQFRENFSQEKPFLMFAEYLRGCIRIIEGEELNGCLDEPIQYSINIGDEISAVQYYSYSLNDKERQNNNILKVQEGLLSCDQLAIYHNTSLFDVYKKVDVEINFFGPFTFKINNVEYCNEFLNRRKLRKIINYLVFNSPNMVSREEIKRVFWEKDKAFDIDANLRVTICNIRKILDKIGYSDMIICEQARIYLNSRYSVNNDFKKYVALYKKAKIFYKNGELYQAETYFKRIVSLSVDVVFKDLSWDYLENKVRNQVQLIINNSLEMLLMIAKNNNNWEKAEIYVKKLALINAKYINELIAILQKNGHHDEAEELIKNKSRKDKSLTNIFFPE